MTDYMAHCEWAFERFGARAKTWLATSQHFHTWLDRFKQQKIENASRDKDI